METREMLEEQLSSSRRRADKVLDLEAEIIKCKQLLNDVALVIYKFFNAKDFNPNINQFKVLN